MLRALTLAGGAGWGLLKMTLGSKSRVSHFPTSAVGEDLGSPFGSRVGPQTRIRGVGVCDQFSGDSQGV